MRSSRQVDQPLQHEQPDQREQRDQPERQNDQVYQDHQVNRVRENLINLKDQPVFVLVLRAEPQRLGGTDIPAEQRLKQLLKLAGRGFSMRCVSVERAPTPGIKGSPVEVY